MNQDIPMPNGLPPNWCGTTPSMAQKNNFTHPQQQQQQQQHVNNGLGSSHSSRDSSPAGSRASVRANMNIPASQLPPGASNRPGVSPIPYNLGLNSSNGHPHPAHHQLLAADVSGSSSTTTPHSSPKIQNFGTSTPTFNNDAIVGVGAVGAAASVNDSTVISSKSVNPNLMRTNLSKVQQQQQQSLIHSSSSPTLQNLQGTVRQDLNQPRPLSSGPQLQQTSQTTTTTTNQSYNYNTAPLQRPPNQNLNQGPLNPFQQPPNPINQMQQPPNLFQQSPNPMQSPPSQMQQPPNQIQPPPNQMQQPPNIMQQPPNVMQQPLNQFQQPPGIRQQPLNQMQQPPNPMTQPLNPMTQPPNPMTQPPNVMAQPPKPMTQPLNQMQQPPKQIQQPLNQLQQPPNPMQQSPKQIPQPLNPMQQPLNQIQQPLNQMQQPLNQIQQPLNPMQQPPNPMQQSPKQIPQPLNPMQQPLNQIQQPLNQMQQPLNQIQQPPNPMQQPPNQIPQPLNPLNQMQQPPKPVTQYPPLPGNQYQAPQNLNQPTAIPPPASYPTTPVSNLHSKRYPQPLNQQQLTPQNTNSNIINYNQQQSSIYNQTNQQPQQFAGNYQQVNQQRNYQQMNQQMQNLNVTKSGFNKMWGHENYDLLQCPNVLPEEAVEPPKVTLGQEFLDAANCSHEIFRCTMTKIPENNSLLQKSRLPLGVLIHPFKDLNHLPVIQCNTIVRCRACRTYINPFIFFVDTKRWKCNLCYRVNELPEEFQYDPVSKSYGDPSRRPEIKSSTIEYIAPSEYMLRPPQPAVYLFLLDISRLAVESGYLHTICDALSSQLATLPGDARTQIGFIAYNTTLHFFSLAEGLNQPHEMIVSDVDDVFLPCPDNLLVNLKEHMDLITDLLAQLPTRYQNSFDTGSALGAALQAAFKMMSSTGGRVTVFQVSLPTVGPGALTVREDPNQRAGKDAPHLNPATDFYKRLALDCSGHQVAVDLFILNSQYVDIATLSGISRFSGGCMHHFPLYKASKTIQAESLDRCFKRYLNRKIGFEAVMRIRCTRGLSIHTFHGNFFVRSTDLLSLPNVNPDAGFGMQVSIEESLADLQSVCFQAALLYTSSKGERRIRVHTLCLPVVNSLSDVLNSADQQCIVGVLSKMAVDRSLQSSLSDARDAFINVAIDILSSYKLSLNMGNSASGLMAPQSLKLLPLYILALLKYTAFRTGQSTRLDDRVFAMCDMKTLPLAQLIQSVYPDLYPVYRLAECPSVVDPDGLVIPQPRRLQLTARNIDSHGAYILDAGQQMFIYVCPNVSQQFLVHCLGVPNYNSIPDPCYELQTIENPDNQRLHAFINSLNDEKPYPAALHIIRDNSTSRSQLLERLIEDRIETALSYNEFLQHLKTQVK